MCAWPNVSEDSRWDRARGGSGRAEKTATLHYCSGFQVRNTPSSTISHLQGHRIQ